MTICRFAGFRRARAGETEKRQNWPKTLGTPAFSVAVLVAILLFQNGKSATKGG
jgi:hypothetical protein